MELRGFDASLPQGKGLQVRDTARTRSCGSPTQAKRGQQVGGIAVARIFHGLSTPAFPVQQWAKCGFWGQFTAWDFSAIAEVARTELAKKG
eukprot:1160179-Pelagomonas_calceolata.AAC.20